MRNLFLLELSVTSKISKRKNREGNILNTQLVDLNKGDSTHLIKETLGIEDSDNFIIGRKNLLVEGEEDKHYITELVNFFELPMCNIIATGGVSNFIKYIEFYNSISENNNPKPKFILLYDNDDAGREQYEKIKDKKYNNIDIKRFFVIDSQKTTFATIKTKPNIEIEDLIYPEIILELTNKILLKKKGFRKIKDKDFRTKIKNTSLRFNGVLDILDNLKNEVNPDKGLELSIKDQSIKGGISNLFNIKGNTEMIKKIQELDSSYPEVKNFLTELMNA